MWWKSDNPDLTTVEYVEADIPVAYTVGLAQRGGPELLVTGVERQRAEQLLLHAAQEIIRGYVPMPGDRITFPDGLLAEWVEVERPVAALQLVWVDAEDRWPWDPTFNDGRGGQPILGMRSVDDWDVAG